MFKIFATDVATKTFYWSMVAISVLFVAIAMLLLSQASVIGSKFYLVQAPGTF